MNFTTIIFAHFIGELALWFVFLLGQCLWVLVCAAAAIRSKHNPITTRREYIELNWDIFLIRFAVEIAVFAIWRHIGLTDLLNWSGETWRILFESSSGPVAAFFLGFGADSLIGFASHWNKLPEGLRMWISERIPQLPEDK